MDNRSIDRIRHHYQVEKKLAEQLKKASKDERKTLYGLLYNELFRLVPDHPQLMCKMDSTERKKTASNQVVFLRRFLRPSDVFLEIGPGDCSLSYEVAKYVQQVYAADVSSEITQNPYQPDNFKLIITDGTSFPLQGNAVNVAYCNQLLEHLHPDDALEQTRNVCNLLAKGGVYICITPHRETGPHDVSGSFDEIATGFHLKEYTYCELVGLMKKAGFKKVKFYLSGKGKYIIFSKHILYILEWLFSKLSHKNKKVLSKKLPCSVIFSAVMVGIK